MPDTIRRRRPQIEGTPDRQILDDQEQEEEIQRQKQQLALTTRSTQRMVFLSIALLGLLYFGLSAWMLLYPWGLPHHAAFEGVVPSSLSVVLADGASGAAAVAACAAVLMCNVEGFDWRSFLALSSTISLLIMGFWGTALFRKVSMEGVDWVSFMWLAWRPVAPLATTIGAGIAIDGVKKMQRQYEALVASQYNVKRA